MLLRIALLAMLAAVAVSLVGATTAAARAKVHIADSVHRALHNCDAVRDGLLRNQRLLARPFKNARLLTQVLDAAAAQPESATPASVASALVEHLRDAVLLQTSAHMKPFPFDEQQTMESYNIRTGSSMKDDSCAEKRKEYIKCAFEAA